MEKKKIAILGSTGSIGTQALDVIAQHHDKFEVVALTTNENIELLAQQVKHFQPGYVGITDDKKAEKFKSCGFYRSGNTGRQGFSSTEIASLPDIDIILIAVVGISGLEPTMEAVRTGKNIALANKGNPCCRRPYYNECCQKDQE